MPTSLQTTDLSLQFDAATIAPSADELRSSGRVRIEPAFTAAAVRVS